MITLYTFPEAFGLRVASRKETPKQEMSVMVDTALSVIGLAAA